MGTPLGRARLQILITGKSILGNRDHGKGMASSHGQGTIAQNPCETPPWLYAGCARDLDKVWGLLMSLFSPQAIFLQLVDPQLCLLRGKFMSAGL